MAKSGKPGRIKQLIQAYRLTRDGDRRIGLWLLGSLVLGWMVGFALFSLIPPGWLALDLVSGLMVGVLVTLIVFGRRAQRSQIKQIEGKPGAAVAVLGSLKRGWRTDQVIAFNRQQDLVHRLVGPPGIVLIGEGDPARLKPLMTAERTKHRRVAAEAPVHEVVIGYGEGQVPLAKLTRHVTKMKREVQPAEITDLLARLKAIDSTRGSVPLPKGPIPTSMKGQRGNMRGR